LPLSNSDEELEILPLINDHCQGLLFMKLWEKKGTELSGQKVLSVKEVLDEVWTPTLDQWNDLCRKLESGNMMFYCSRHGSNICTITRFLPIPTHLQFD
jgi:hypothetical protein